jgi:hypothetical protein
MRDLTGLFSLTLTVDFHRRTADVPWFFVTAPLLREFRQQCQVWAASNATHTS